jgi:hypothetical protein
MKNVSRNFLCSSVFMLSVFAIANAQSDDGKIRVIMFGAHPDDCDRVVAALRYFFRRWVMP